MISKTKISQRINTKRNPEIKDSIILAKKKNLLQLARKLSSPKQNYKTINLDEINKIEGNNFVIIGKVLGSGEIERKLKISALGFSEQAVKKLKKAGCDVKSVKVFIEENKSLEGVKVL